MNILRLAVLPCSWASSFKSTTRAAKDRSTSQTLVLLLLSGYGTALSVAFPLPQPFPAPSTLQSET
eukprot:scaffold7381_cov310-Pinguiococcus_pyrenoidosus.AAC.38